MSGRQIITLSLLGIGAYVAYQYYVQVESQGPTDSETDPSNSAINGSIVDTLQTLYENAMNTLSPGAWMTQGQGPVYAPTFAVVEQSNGIPQNLLFRMSNPNIKLHEIQYFGFFKYSVLALSLFSTALIEIFKEASFIFGWYCLKSVCLFCM